VLTVNSNLTLAGNLFIEVDKSTAQTNDAVFVAGALANSGSGTVTITNLNPGLPFANNDVFAVFNKALTGTAMSISPPTPGPGLAWVNNLAVDGTIGVTNSSGPTLSAVAPNPVIGSSFPVILTLTGSGFVAPCDVLLTNLATLAGSSYPVGSTDGSHLSVPAVLGAASANATWNATVVNNGGATSGQVTFTVNAPARPKVLNVTSPGHANVIMSGTGGSGMAGDSYVVLGTTNVAQSLSLWQRLATNQFDGSGTFSCTNAVTPGQPRFFYGIQQ
jgi:hypothetical protein